MEPIKAKPGAVSAVDPPLRGDVGVRRFFSMHILGLLFPLAAGVMLYGWRGLGAIALVLIGTVGGLAIWRMVGARGRRISLAQGTWLGLLLAMMLPAHLMSATFPGAGTVGVWGILAGAGLALATVLWMIGGLGSGRVHPVLIVYLVVAALFASLLVPHFVLHRGSIFIGDVLDVGVANPRGLDMGVRKDPWTAMQTQQRDALYAEPASAHLSAYTRGTATPDRAALSMEELIRDRLPPLEDLIVGGAPAPVGMGSAVAVIMGGLYLLYRGLIDFRIPLMMCIAAYVMFFLLPVPVAITEQAMQWRSLAVHRPGVGWSTAITFVNYEMMAGPMLFTAFFLATAPGIRPMTRRGRSWYAIMIGILAAAFQLYFDVSYGPYLALLLIGLLTPALDRWFRPKPLV